METQEAIEVLELQLRLTSPILEPKLTAALRLAIHALKRHRDQDYLSYLQLRDKLPGEVTSYAR